MRMRHLEHRSKFITNDRRKPKAKHAEPGDDEVTSSCGFFHLQLSEQLQESCVEMARRLRDSARKWERADRKEQAEYRENETRTKFVAAT